MKRLLVLVEGQTEEAFVRDVLTPHLAIRDTHPTAVLLKTKRVKSGGAFRGGVTSTEQVLGDTRRLCADGGAAVTTMLDYYGLPDDFPGMPSRPKNDAYSRVAHVEAAFATAIGIHHFIPHLVLHEYEAWIYSAPAACAWVFEDNASVVEQLVGIAATAGGAERINEHRATAPSKQLARLYPPYKKTLHGPMAVDAIGLAAVRAKCPHAAAWLDAIEAL